MPATRKQPATPEATPSSMVMFDHGKEQLVFDMKGVSSIPYDTDETGIESTRAFILPRNQFVHVPDVPGHYTTVDTDEPKVITALMKVHFNPATKKKPGLLVGVQDFGIANAARHGQFVRTVELPLEPQRGKFSNVVSVSPIELVQSFEPISDKELPWSKDMIAWLKQFEHFKSLGIKDMASLHSFIDKPLKDRMPLLEKLAEASITAALADFAKEDKQTADIQAAQFKASLRAVIEKLHELGLHLYDKPLSQRITNLNLQASPGEDTAPLASPLAAELRGGRAAMSMTALFGGPRRSHRQTTPIAGGPLVPAPRRGASGSSDNAPIAAAAPSPGGSVLGLMRLAGEDAEGGEGAVAAAALSPAAAVDSAKRRRTSTSHYVPGEDGQQEAAKANGSKGKGKAAASAPAASAPATGSSGEAAAPFGHFPQGHRHAGDPRKRPAYNMTGKLVLDAAAASNPAAALAVEGKKMDKIKELEKQLKEQKHRIEYLEMELNFNKQGLEKAQAEKMAAVHEAESKLRLQYRDDKLTSYQDGMEAAMKLMQTMRAMH